MVINFYTHNTKTAKLIFHKMMPFYFSQNKKITTTTPSNSDFKFKYCLQTSFVLSEKNQQKSNKNVTDKNETKNKQKKSTVQFNHDSLCLPHIYFPSYCCSALHLLFFLFHVCICSTILYLSFC